VPVEQLLAGELENFLRENGGAGTEIENAHEWRSGGPSENRELVYQAQ
jgi:hypothetical protein